jgi:protein-disulfide isomerase
MKIHKSILNNRLKNLKSLPVDKTFLAANKDQLMDTIYHDPLLNKGEQMRTSYKSRFAFRLKTIPIASLIILIVAGSGTAMASQNSLPSDLLYPVKLLTEEIKEDLTFNEVKKAELTLEHANKRIAELKKLGKVNPNALKDERMVAKVLNNYEHKIASSVNYINRTPSHKLITKLRYATIDTELTQNKEDLTEVKEGLEEKTKTKFEATITDIEERQTDYLVMISDRAKRDDIAAEAEEEIISNKLAYWENKIATSNIFDELANAVTRGSEAQYETIKSTNEKELQENANEKIRIYRQEIVETKNTTETLPMIQKEIYDWERKVVKAEIEINSRPIIREVTAIKTEDIYNSPILKNEGESEITHNIIEEKIGITENINNDSGETIMAEEESLTDRDLNMIIYTDYQCPYCANFESTIQEIYSEYNIDIDYRNYPLTSIHPHAFAAAEAVECANEQGRFSSYHQALFANQSSLNNEDALFLSLAEELNLDYLQFEECLSSHKYQETINNDIALGINDGVNGTPTSFINGQRVAGSLPYESIKEIIEDILN